MLAKIVKKGRIRIGSFCTGFGTEKVVIKALQEVWNTKFSHSTDAVFEVDFVFVVESDKKKLERLVVSRGLLDATTTFVNRASRYYTSDAL